MANPTDEEIEAVAREIDPKAWARVDDPRIPPGETDYSGVQLSLRKAGRCIEAYERVKGKRDG